MDFPAILSVPIMRLCVLPWIPAPPAAQTSTPPMPVDMNAVCADSRMKTWELLCRIFPVTRSLRQELRHVAASVLMMMVTLMLIASMIPVSMCNRLL